MSKSKFQLLSLMAMGLAMGSQSIYKEPKKVNKPKKIIPKGCKEYNIDGKKIIALNEKSAVRKYNNLVKGGE
jgi:hypothetical protein